MTARGLAVLVLATAMGCSRKPPDGAIRYGLTGKVIEVRTTAREVLIAHDDIQGFMPAMTMPFRFREGAALPVLASGDEIQATLAVTQEASWIEDVRVLRHGAPIVLPKAPTPQGGIGDEVPDFELTNQDRKTVHTNSYRGKALVVGFIYTRCPMPEFCPLMMRNFKLLAQRFAADPDLRERTHLLTVSFDIERDTPEVLRGYGRLYMDPQNPKPFEHWELATGTKEQIGAITRFFGVSFEPDSEGTIGHSLMTGVVGPDGKLAALYPGNAWDIEQALKGVRRSLSLEVR